MNLLSDTKCKRGKQSVAETNIRHGSKIKKIKWIKWQRKLYLSTFKGFQNKISYCKNSSIKCTIRHTMLVCGRKRNRAKFFSALRVTIIVVSFIFAFVFCGYPGENVTDGFMYSVAPNQRHLLQSNDTLKEGEETIDTSTSNKTDV
jgi:hypothetical protein